VHRQDQHRAAGEFLLHVAQQVEAAAPGHGEVEDRHVPFELACHGERFVAVGCFPYDGRRRVRREHLLQAVPHDRVIVCYEYSHVVFLPR
jgi:hypothetical protein